MCIASYCVHEHTPWLKRFEAAHSTPCRTIYEEAHRRAVTLAVQMQSARKGAQSVRDTLSAIGRRAHGKRRRLN
jgi:hypothetical protein